MKYAMIGTWKMSFAGVSQAAQLLSQGAEAKRAIEYAIRMVEDEPRFCSVGYGGLPGRDGKVTLDAAYMDGNTLRFGGVMSVENLKNPISAAILLSSRKRSCLLAGEGAACFARDRGLELRDMRTENSLRRFQAAQSQPLPLEEGEAYRGHDTVCVLALDKGGSMGVGTSTSGLFMKEPGRIGDTPIIGSGFYCDARVGGAAATGLGEDIMRGCLSFNVVALMKQGVSAQAACERVLKAHQERMAELGYPDGGMSLIAMDKDGGFGAATTIEAFPFALAREGEEPSLYCAFGDGVTKVRRATAQEEADTRID